MLEDSCGNESKHNLSENYCNGIQKIMANEQAISDGYEMPKILLEERKDAWNSLFQKYLNISKADDNMATLESEADGEDFMENPTVLRLPMRKSMSMIQYWVDTGNQPYAEYLNDRTHSDLGSSLSEEEIFARSANINLSMEKHNETVSLSNNNLMKMRIASSPNSSVDTAAYISANKNTTKKAETLVILEGSKLVDQQQSNFLQSLSLVDNVNSKNKSVEKMKMNKKCNANEETVQKTNTALKVKHFKENINKTNCNNKKSGSNNNNNNNNGSQKFDPNITNIVSQHSYREQQVSGQCNEESESDESLIHGKLNTEIQRKKLYSKGDSPVEFAAASETPSTPRAPRLSIKPCVHPAFQTPKLTRLSYPAKRSNQNYVKKKRFRSLSFALSKIKFNNTTQTSIPRISETETNKDKTEINVSNLMKSKSKSKESLKSDSCDCNSKDNRIMQQSVDRKKNSDMQKSLDCNNRFNLKMVKLNLQRLPYINRNTKVNTGETKNLRNEIINPKEVNSLWNKNEEGFNQLNTACSNNELSDNLLSKSIENIERHTQEVSLTKQTTPENIKKSKNLKEKKEIASKGKENSSENGITDMSLIHYKESVSNLEKVKAVDRRNNTNSTTLRHKSPLTRTNNTLLDKSTYMVVVSSDESEGTVDVPSEKCKKRLSKRKSTINGKLSNSRASKSLNLNAKKSPSKLKSIIDKPEQSDRRNTFNLTANPQRNTSNTYKIKLSKIKEKCIDFKIRKKNPAVSCKVKKTDDCIINNNTTISNKNKHAKRESKNKNKNEKISEELMNKPLAMESPLLQNKVTNLNGVPAKKLKNNGMQSGKLFNKDEIDVVKRSSDKKNYEPIKSKKRMLDEDCEDLQKTNSKIRARKKFKPETTKENKLKNNLKDKTDEIFILSDNDCIVPLKI